MAESNTKCNHKLIYAKRPGTDNKGGDYELYVTALFAVRLVLDASVQDVQMAPNVDKYGAFDDIVIRVQHKSGATILYLLQLKHKKKVHGSVDFINKTKGDFSLEKYKDSYYKDIKERMAKGELDDLLRGVELKDVAFCLFTNAVYSKATNKIILNERESLSCKIRRCSDTDFIDTTPKGCQVFKMRTERPSFAQFLISYLFIDYQKGYEVIIKKIEGKFGKSEISRIKKIGRCFKEQLKIEIKQDEMDFDCILIRVGESVREMFKEVESDLLEGILSEMSDYFRVEYKSAQELYEEYSSKCAEYSEFFKRFKFYGGQLNCEQVKAAIASRIEASLGKCTPEVVREFLEYIQDYFQGNHLLVKQQIQRKLLEVMLPLVPSEEVFEKQFQVFQMVTDLNDPEQKLMVSKHIQVALQGRQGIRLCDIVDSIFCRSQEPEFFLNHMGSVVQVGKILEMKCENYYIEREFGKIFLERDVLKKKHANCIFIVNIFGNSYFLNYMRNEVNIIDLRDRRNLPNDFPSNSKNNVILISNKGHVNETLMKSINLKVNTVHYLNAINGDLLEWKGSRNKANPKYQKDFFSSCFRIQNEGVKNSHVTSSKIYEKTECIVKEKKLLQYFKSTVNIISAQPGMGKSTVLNSLIQYSSSNKWVLKLCLNEWNSDLNNRFNEILEDPLQYMFEKSEGVCNDKFSKDLFGYMKNRDAVMVFIDAFDEIAPRYTEGVLKLISKLEHLGICTWVFTRSNLEECLERKFNTKAINILPLGEDEIRRYLLKNTKLDELSLKVLLQEVLDFVRIPLHLYMLSTNLRSVTLNRNKLKVAELYEIFMTIKCDIYYKKFSINREINHVEDLVPSPEKLIEKHQLLSLLVTFDEEFLVKNEVASHSKFEKLLSEFNKYKNHIGLVSAVHDSTPVFTHRTFAEFLTARWLSKNKKHKAFKRMCQSLQDSYSDIVQFWFNEIAPVEYPLHAAVVDGDLEKVRQLCKQPGLVLCDALNRTPLHLAMVCFRNQQFYEIPESSEVACKITNEICEHLANTKSFVTHKDIFGSYWHEYAASYNEIFLSSCYWGCKALMMMFLTRTDFINENRMDFDKGSLYLSEPHHEECMRLQHLLRNPLSRELSLLHSFAYALKFCVINDSPYLKKLKDSLCSRDSKKMDFTKHILHLFLAETSKKFEAISKDSLEALEESFGLTSIVQDLNILERIEMVTKIQLTGCTPLCAAAFLGHLNSVKVMGSGTVNANPGDEFIPLHYAVDGGNLDVITWLIETDADVNQMDANGNVAVSCLLNTKRTKLEIMELLIKKGANVTVKNQNGKSCFGLAAYYKNLDVVKLFIKNGIHVDYRDNENELTALRHAIQSEQPVYVSYFLSKGADVNIKVNGMTSLDYALNVNFINWQIVRMLMDADTDINYVQNLSAFAPLICAVEENQLDVAQYIISKQDDVTTANVSDLTALNPKFLFILQTVRRITLKSIHKLLVKNGKHSSVTLFSSAIAECQANLWKVPLDKIYITLKIYGGVSTFGKAIKHQNWELVMLFIENGVNVDYRDNVSEFTALHKAVQTDHLDYVQYFLDQLADVNLKVREKTSLDLALENERVNWEMVRLLVESGADVNCRHNQKGYTPLHYAVEENHLDMVEFLINKEADVSITDTVGLRTPPRLAHHLKRRKIMNFFKQRLV